MNNLRNEIDRVLRDVDAEEAARLREVWESVGAVDPADTQDVIDETAVARLKQNIEHTIDRRAPRQPPKQPPLKVRLDRSAVNGRVSTGSKRMASVWAGVLVAASVVFMIGLWWYIQPAVILTAPGQTLTHDMPDGSIVELNSDSKLSYHRGLDGLSVRSVRLDGEAFFRVTHGPTFVVRTFNAEVRVLGTEFNVRAREVESERGTVVALESGSVTLNAADDPDRAVLMSPGELRRILMSGAGIVLDSTSSTLTDALAWRRGELVFRDESLQSIIAEIRRRYDIDVRLDAGIVDGRRWNLALRNPGGAEGAVRDVAGMAGIRYRRIAGGFELFSEAR
ncbi:MAG: FecR domain-containing protein [Rhodothermia bacterium]|nr:FecR domain-containing protein [Rhodothermia bacterium]